MRGHPAITVKWFLTGTAGVVARGLLCAGQPETKMGIGARQGWRGPTCFPMCAVTCAGAPDAPLHVPRVRRTWRGWSMRHTWRPRSKWRNRRTRRAWHARAPGCLAR
eukprot:5783331-Pyramimonas_sp.AAC.1